MRTGRPKQPLILTDEERERLESLAHRSRSQPLLAKRARVVLACAEGQSNQSKRSGLDVCDIPVYRLRRTALLTPLAFALPSPSAISCY